MSLIVNFPARYAFTNADGTLTPEAYRMLREWFVRIGGTNTSDLSEIESMLLNLAFNDSTAMFAELRKAIESQDPPVDYSAQIAELKKEIDELRRMIAFTSPPPVIAGDVYASIF
jgi:hypothetical protein